MFESLINKNSPIVHINMKIYHVLLIYIFLFMLFSITFNATAENEIDPIRTLLPYDAIPAITKPQFVSATEAKLDIDAPVIGVTFNGESHAYSLYLLNGHEIVNDVVGGKKIATTW